MVLCKYFITGNCRFGSKCNNEHLDVRQIVKSDIDTALNGKQWPFSCYGPFKDKPCIPNFIEDQSFEELRLLCYHAKCNNYFERYHQEFSKEVVDVKNKMKSLQQLTPEAIDVIIKLHNAPVVKHTGTSSEKSVFAVNNMTVQQPGFNKYGATDISVAKVPLAFGSVFNSAANANVPPSVNLFASNNAFGSAAAQQQQQPSLHQPIANNVESNFTFLPQPASANIFSQAGNQTQLTIGGMMSQLPAATQVSSMSAGNFNYMQTEQTSQGNNFGQPTNIFHATQAPMEQNSNNFATVAQSTPNNTAAFEQQSQASISNNANSKLQEQKHRSLDLYSLYSQMEDLTEEEIQAFRSERFTLSTVPGCPPPKELIN